MGCDIHVFLEKKVNNNWLFITNFKRNQATEGRNYERFAALAGVRGEGPAARGLPVNVSESVKYLTDGLDYHSHSWLNLKIAAAIFLATAHEELTEYKQKHPEDHFFGVDIGPAYGDAADYRVIFCFDN